MDDLISKSKVIKHIAQQYKAHGEIIPEWLHIGDLPSTQPEGYVKIPETGINDLSDGFHTFRQLYYQRMMLFATIVKQNKEKAWKSLRHEDGELCFGGGWFIVGIDTPEGSYTYHYEDNFYNLFDCKELKCGKHWDGHTEKDVTRLLTLPSAQPDMQECEKCIFQPFKQFQSERKRGKWVNDRGLYKCSNCNHVFSELWWVETCPIDRMNKIMRFCPQCGAEMETEK